MGFSSIWFGVVCCYMMFCFLVSCLSSIIFFPNPHLLLSISTYYLLLLLTTYPPLPPTLCATGLGWVWVSAT